MGQLAMGRKLKTEPGHLPTIRLVCLTYVTMLALVRRIASTGECGRLWDTVTVAHLGVWSGQGLGQGPELAAKVDLWPSFSSFNVQGKDSNQLAVKRGRRSTRRNRRWFELPERPSKSPCLSSDQELRRQGTFWAEREREMVKIYH